MGPTSLQGLFPEFLEEFHGRGVRERLCLIWRVTGRRRREDGAGGLSENGGPDSRILGIRNEHVERLERQGSVLVRHLVMTMGAVVSSAKGQSPKKY